jgi:hypothetical protein
MSDPVESKFEAIKKSLERAEMMGECLTKMLEFIEMKGLSDELLAYLHGREDRYFFAFLKRKRMQP